MVVCKTLVSKKICVYLCIYVTPYTLNYLSICLPIYLSIYLIKTSNVGQKKLESFCCGYWVIVTPVSPTRTWRIKIVELVCSSEKKVAEDKKRGTLRGTLIVAVLTFITISGLVEVFRRFVRTYASFPGCL
jgi:hypothetical protein